MPNLDKVSRGDPIKIEAATFNTMLEAADDFARRRRSGAEPSPSNDPHVGATMGLVRWDADTLPSGSVVGYGAAVVAPATDPYSVRRRYVWVGTTPASESDPFAITVEPIVRGGYGRAAVLGQTVVDIDVTDEDHTHAVPIVGYTTKLASATSGPAVILSKPEGTGVLRCEVLIGAGGGAGGCAGSVCTDYYTGLPDTTGYGPGTAMIPSYLLLSGQSAIVLPTATPMPENEEVVIQAAILAGPIPSAGGQSWNGVWGRLVALDSTTLTMTYPVTDWVPLGFVYYPYASTGLPTEFDPPRHPGGYPPTNPARQGSVAARRTFPPGTLVAWQIHYATGNAFGTFVNVYGVGAGPTYIIVMTGCGSCEPTAPASQVPAPPPTPRVPDPSAPVASFDHTPQSGLAELAVAFTDTSTGSPTAWVWDFGDGTGSSEQHPSHAYKVAGRYLVVLTVRNTHGASMATGHVIVYEAGAVAEPSESEKLSAAFRPMVGSGVAPFTALFEDMTTGGELPLEYHLSYGDDTVSGPLAALPTTHEYTSAGSYLVTLMVVDAMKSVSVATEIITVESGEYVDSGDGSLTASYGFTAPSGLNSAFTDTSGTTGGPITSWAWDFGDGGSSSLQNPSHTWAAPGTYTVRLTVSSATDSDWTEQDIAVT